MKTHKELRPNKYNFIGVRIWLNLSHMVQLAMCLLRGGRALSYSCLSDHIPLRRIISVLRVHIKELRNLSEEIEKSFCNLSSHIISLAAHDKR